ncbi:MAG: hypothetical protein ISQ13_03400 [Candidatus Margulisbacteria bacterium]|nr:hypothetical protein [Candidatus Margulisiibacteriota bacterium]
MGDVSSIGPNLPSLVEEIMKNCENDGMLSGIVNSSTNTNELLDKLSILETATQNAGIVSAITNIRQAVDSGVSLTDLKTSGPSAL